MDGIIKKYFDTYRDKQQLPPELAAVTQGRLVDGPTIQNWRFWKTGLAFVDKDHSKLIGAFDDCLVSEGKHVPVDYKTRGYALRDDSTSYYILQMSCYGFLLSKNGYPTSDYAYLIFYIPEVFTDKGVVNFSVQVKKVEIYPVEKVYQVFRDALVVLQKNEPPEAALTCSFCAWAKSVGHSDQKQLKLF